MVPKSLKDYPTRELCVFALEAIQLLLQNLHLGVIHAGKIVQKKAASRNEGWADSRSDSKDPADLDLERLCL